MKVKEFWHINQNESEIRENIYSPVSSGNQLIKTMFSLISTGTERTIAKGLVPDDMKEIMKVPYMQGNFDFPVKYGYSLVGKVIQGDPELLNKTVHLMHPHQDYALVPENHLTLIPDSIPAQRAVLASNMETAVNAIWVSGISAGDNILVCGFGIIGALIAIVARQFPAVNVFVHDTEIYRSQIASSMGFSIFEKKTSSVRFDLAFNTTASGEALQICIDTTMPESKIIEVSWYGSDSVNIRLGSLFHIEQKQIIASQVSNIPFNKRGHFNHKRRKKLVFDLLQNSIFDQLPFHMVAFEQLPDVFRQLRNLEYNQFATIVKY